MPELIQVQIRNSLEAMKIFYVLRITWVQGRFRYHRYESHGGSTIWIILLAVSKLLPSFISITVTQKNTQTRLSTLFLHLRRWLLLERMDTGFMMEWRHIQIIQVFLRSLWCGNLDDIPLKSSSLHPSQMLFQMLTTLMTWGNHQNPIVWQFLPSP